MERYHIYKLGLAILFYMVYCGRKAVVHSLKVDDATSASNTTDYRERRDSGDDTFFSQAGDGTPGVDYPTLSYVPRTKFSCRDMEAGYYADLETDCQVFHICDEGRKLSFLCPNGTIFQQGELICDWWFKVNCSTSPLLYEESAEILHRASAKRKESRRNHGTKQGVFSSKEDYDYKDYKDLKIHSTPSHFVTPSYPHTHKVSLKTFDNSISASTEGSIRRNYNIRTDRKLESVGNGVKEATSRFAASNNENTFSINLQGKSNDRGRTTFGGFRQTGNRGTSFTTKNENAGISQFSSDKTTQQSSRNQDRFSTNFQKNSRKNNSQGKSEESGQTKVTATSRSNFGVNFPGKSERFGQTTFGTSTQRDQKVFETTLDDKLTVPTRSSFGINLQDAPDRFSQTTFSANAQRDQKITANALQAKTTASTRSSFGRQFTFGKNDKTTTTTQLPLVRTSQQTFTRQGQHIFGSRLQDSGTIPKQSNFDSNLQRSFDNREKLQSKTVENFDARETSFNTNLQRKSETRVEFARGSNTQRFDGPGRNKFSAVTQAPFKGGELSTLAASFQGGEFERGSNTQQRSGGSGGHTFSAVTQAPFTGGSLNTLAASFQGGESERGSNIQQRFGGSERNKFSTVTQAPFTGGELSTLAASFQGGEFERSSNTQQRFSGSGRNEFSTVTQAPFTEGQLSTLAASFQGEFNAFGSTADANRQHTASTKRIDDGRDKIKFSITSRDQSHKFGQPNLDTRKQEQSNDGRYFLGGQDQRSQGIQGNIKQNQFDARDKHEQYQHTTSKFGLTSKEKSYTTESGKLFSSTSSAETQEPQETASFVKNFRNNIADGSSKQRTTNLYPNHRETYSEIKDPRYYHERPQSKLPEKPFYGSSINPQVLSTVPVSAQTSSPTVTIEANTNTGFGFKSHTFVTQTPPYINQQQRFSVFTSKEPNKFTTTRRFGFDVKPTQETNVGLKQNTDNIYSKDVASGVDVSLNSISSTLQPDFTTESNVKSTALPGTQRTSYYRDKAFGIRGRTRIDTSTPAVGISSYSYTKVPTIENARTDSPVIKLNIIPSTALPGFDLNDRTGKAFSVESPKTQIIQDSKVFTIPRREYDGSTLPVNISPNRQGFIGTSAINQFISSNPTVSSGSLKGRIENIPPTVPSNVYQVYNFNRLTPSVTVGGFGSSTTPNPLQAISTPQFAINQEENSVRSTIGSESVDFTINNQLYPISTTENINLRTDITSTVTEPTTTNSGTGKDGLIVTINDQKYSTPPSQSTETVSININDEYYSTPASQFTSTAQTGFGFTATTATPTESQTTENVLYTSPSSLLQPKPFSFSTKTSPVFLNSVTPTEGLSSSAKPCGRTGSPTIVVKQPGLSQLPPYKLSSASPFATFFKSSNDNNFKTPVPTLPTPFTTKATLLHRTRPIDENVSNMINTLIEAARQRFGGNDTDNGYNTPRPGLIVPPSAGPQTLHTLAIYFANALDNLTDSTPKELAEHTDDETETDSPIIHIDNDEFIKSLLTQMTLENYEGLFKDKDDTTTETSLGIRSGADDSENDLLREDTKHPLEGPPVRQLARVFTEALSAYLDDPDTFKKVLHDVRPTEPPQTTARSENVEGEEEDEVLNYSDSDLKSDHPHLPTRPTGIPVSPTWGYILAFNKTISNIDNLESRNSLNSDNENLQSADSQSLISQLNKVTRDFKTTPTTTDRTYEEVTETTTAPNTVDVEANALRTLPEDHWTASLDVAKLWQTTLSVNPATLNENFGTTKAERDENIDNSQSSGVTNSEESSSESSDLTTVSEIQYELRSLPKLELNSTQVHGILIDFMSANKTDGSAKLQRILHKLNITQDEFLDKMKEIEGNPLTRRLILLLISECNTDKNRELETRSTVADEIYGAKINTDHAKLTSPVPQNDDPYTEPVGDVTESNLFKQIVHPSLDDGDEDTRALELLNSLYVIASKFGK